MRVKRAAQRWNNRRPGLALVLVLLVLGVLLIAKPAFAEDANTCGGTMDNPHFSSGAGGVIAKWHVHCNSGGRDVTGNLYLYRCAMQIDAIPNEDHLSAYCNLEGHTSVNIPNMTAGKVYTRYVPPSGQPGAKGTGWWIACAMWYSSGPAGVLGPHTNWSAAVNISA